METEIINLECNGCKFPCKLQLTGLKGQRGPMDKIVCPLQVRQPHWTEVDEPNIDSYNGGA